MGSSIIGIHCSLHKLGSICLDETICVASESGGGSAAVNARVENCSECFSGPVRSGFALPRTKKASLDYFTSHGAVLSYNYKHHDTEAHLQNLILTCIKTEARNVWNWMKH